MTETGILLAAVAGMLALSKLVDLRLFLRKDLFEAKMELIQHRLNEIEKKMPTR